MGLQLIFLNSLTLYSKCPVSYRFMSLTDDPRVSNINHRILCRRSVVESRSIGSASAMVAWLKLAKRQTYTTVVKYTQFVQAIRTCRRITFGLTSIREVAALFSPTRIG